MIELWLIYGLVGAFVNGLFNTYQKVLTNNGRSPIEILVSMHTVAFVVLVPTLVIYNPVFSWELSGLLILTGALNGLSFYYLAIAYDYGALSIVAPLRGITPILVAFIEPFVFPDFGYNYALVIASFLVGLGIYILLYEDSITKPITRIKDKGVSRGILSAAIISLAVLVDRYALLETSIEPEPYAALVVFSSLVASLIITWKVSDIQNVLKFDREILPIGILRAISIFMVFGALSLAQGTKVNIILQLGVIIATIAGGGLLGEENIIRRILGVILILVAAVIVATT